ncbi:N-acetylmuramoyl-L-alanine amidase [Salinimicrobium xinjiangense]|uniref:N-acetylmuramoyl-L-alanine amidase n=1 Tax=Salinimicrobium xinjiangense TaxID=438596 RepID=UPI000422CF19|nr:N-acetylmuramoyl-L-alanine amidase [Salinimicrobium xinjiangense]
MKYNFLIFFSLLLISCGSNSRDNKRIVDRPIEFNEERRQLSLEYMKERYGLEQEEPTIDPKMIVLHWTEIPTLESSFAAFNDPLLPGGRTEIAGAGKLNVSAHFLVDRDGTIYRLMPETLMGRHVIGLNHVAIGVENVGGTEDTPLTQAQLEANIWLVKYLNNKYNIDYIIGHHEYTSFEDHDLWLEKDAGYRTQKSDPGEEFMEKLRAATKILGFKEVPKSHSNEIAELIREIAENYDEYKENTLKERRIKYQDILPLIGMWSGHSSIEVQQVGTSIEGRKLFLLSIGSGETDVFLWSQMHGDESTATMAVFDILNFFAHDSYNPEKQALLKKVKLHFLPMLNPDGAEVFQRRNALGIDVNRDALRLQSPEAQTLKRVRDSLDADFGFNLHDQSRYYNAEGSPNPATISFLAPAYDYEKSVNEVRGNAMRLIVQMNQLLQHYAPGNVGRYNDDFEPRAFGDNIQKWGTSTILIESGGFPGDPEKQEIRKFNFVAILAALFSISEEDYLSADIADYQKIPENDSKLFDLKLTGLNYELEGETYILDLGINRAEIPAKGDKTYYYHSRIADQGDLSTNYGYEVIDVLGYTLIPGKIHPETFDNLQAVAKLNFAEILSSGVAFVRVRDLKETQTYTEYPVQVVGEKFKVPEKLEPGMNPTFFLKKNEEAGYAIINGFVIPLDDPEPKIENGLILRN